MQPCGELESAALDFANDTELNNLIGHIGSDGNSTSHRIKKYGNWDVKIGECLRYGNENPRDIVVAWLVDDNKPLRGHRNNVLQPGMYIYLYLCYAMLYLTKNIL